MSVNEDRLMEFLHRFVGDLGATMGAGGVVVGDRLGLYRGLLDAAAAARRARRDRTGTATRYIEEWLRGQAAGGYVEYDAGAGTVLPDRGAGLRPDRPRRPGVPARRLRARPRRAAGRRRHQDAFRTGDGVGWHQHDDEVFAGCERFFRPGYIGNLVASWIPALDGVRGRLRARCPGGRPRVRARRVDHADGARRSPRPRSSARDYHGGSIEAARERAAEAGGRPGHASRSPSAQDFTRADLDLVTTFDCLHDMGDPLGAARHIRGSLAADGTWMIVEPAAGDTVADNLNPVGRVYYSFSTFLCVPNAMSQAGGYALGAQAGEAAIRQVVTDAGFTRFRRVAETPFNLVYEARP